MFEFQIDRERGLITTRLWGLWDLDTAVSFARAHLATVGALGLAAGEHLVLAEFGELAVLTKDAIETIEELVDGNLARRIALVAPGALSRLQVTRLLFRPNVRIFEEPDDAERWLFTGEAIAGGQDAPLSLDAGR